MFRAKDVILYKKIRFRFSSEGFMDILKKSIKCIFAYLSFLGKLLKEFSKRSFFGWKLLKGFRHGRFVAQIMAFDVPEVFIYRFATQKAQKTLFQKIFFKKRLKKNDLQFFWKVEKIGKRLGKVEKGSNQLFPIFFQLFPTFQKNCKSTFFQLFLTFFIFGRKIKKTLFQNFIFSIDHRKKIFRCWKKKLSPTSV